MFLVERFTWHFHSKEELLTGIIKHYGPHSMLRPVTEQIEQDLQNGVPLDDETILRRIAGAFYDSFTAMATTLVWQFYSFTLIPKLLTFS